MRKKLIVLGVVVTASMGAGGWFYAKREAKIAVENEVESFLIKNGLKPYITYDDITASPFGTAELTNLSVRSPQGARVLSIRSIKFSDTKIKRDIILSANITATELEIPLLDIVRSEPGSGIPSEPILQILGMGYSTLSGNFSYQWNFEESRQILSVEAKGDFRDLGGFDWSLKLGGVSSGLMSYQSPNMQSLRGNLWQSAMTEFLKAQGLNFITLNELRFKLSDDGFFKRTKNFTDNNIPKESSLSETQNNNAYTNLVSAGVLPSDAKSTIEAVNNWLLRGGSIRLETNLTQPLPLFSQWSSFAASPLKFLAAAKVKITN